MSSGRDVGRAPELAAELAGRLDALLADDDAERVRRYPGPSADRQPVHTAYVPANRFSAGTARQWGEAALRALDEHGPIPGFDEPEHDKVRAKLVREPVEDLRIDFEDGYGIRPDEVEDAAASRPPPPWPNCSTPPAARRCRAAARRRPAARRAAVHRAADEVAGAGGPPPRAAHP